MINVLFVCLGNICRSPLAEGIFQHFVDEADLAGQISCDSCGTSSYHIGESAHPMSRRVAQSNGIELTSRARQFKSHDFEDFDYIIAMDYSNIKNLASFDGYKNGESKVFKMRKFDNAQTARDVMDTYGGDFSDFEHCFEVLKECCGNLLTHIQKQHLGNN